MTPIKQASANYSQMAIIEKYEKIIAYLYPIAQSMPKKQGVIRDLFLKALFYQVELFYVAGKSNQVSKIYDADAGLAHLRFWLRFLVMPSTRGLTPHQHQVVLLMLAEVGSMLGSWLTKRKGQNG